MNDLEIIEWLVSTEAEAIARKIKRSISPTKVAAIREALTMTFPKFTANRTIDATGAPSYDLKRRR